MRATFCSCMKQSVFSIAFFASAAGCVIVLIFASVDAITEALRTKELLEAGWHNAQLLNAVKSDAFMLTVPILAAIPYATAFVDDLKSGYIRLYLHRTTFGRYLICKIAVCTITGGLAIIIGYFAVYAIFTGAFMPAEAPGGGGGIFDVLKCALNVFLTGCLWSCVGMLLSAVTENRYIAYVSPFIVCYLLIILHERYARDFYALYPVEWLAPVKSWPFGGFSILLLVVELIAICVALFLLIGGRRLRRL